MNKIIAILEDDNGRTELMRQDIAERLTNCDCMTFDNAPDMIAWLKDSLEQVVIISLDHDLESTRGRDGNIFEAGTGRDVVDFLESKEPVCPVIIHTANNFGGDGMMYALKDAGWKAKRIVPLGDLSWIEDEWIQVVIDLMDLR